MLPVTIVTYMIWESLDDGEKATLHSTAVTNPTADLSKLNSWPKTEPLATESNNSMHKETVRSVKILAARWHAMRRRKQGHLSSLPTR